jgi:hypothetical protein
MMVEPVVSRTLVNGVTGGTKFCAGDAQGGEDDRVIVVVIVVVEAAA